MPARSPREPKYVTIYSESYGRFLGQKDEDRVDLVDNFRAGTGRVGISHHMTDLTFLY